MSHGQDSHVLGDVHSLNVFGHSVKTMSWYNCVAKCHNFLRQPKYSDWLNKDCKNTDMSSTEIFCLVDKCSSKLTPPVNLHMVPQFYSWLNKEHQNSDTTYNEILTSDGKYRGFDDICSDFMYCIQIGLYANYWLEIVSKNPLSPPNTHIFSGCGCSL